LSPTISVAGAITLSMPRKRLSTSAEGRFGPMSTVLPRCVSLAPAPLATGPHTVSRIFRRKRGRCWPGALRPAAAQLARRQGAGLSVVECSETAEVAGKLRLWRLEFRVGRRVAAGSSSAAVWSAA
jgi:DNA-binding IclR family transcriptional regulator